MVGIAGPVDAEAYVTHVLQLVIGATASAAVTEAVLESDAHARYDRELACIAKASLFQPDAAGRRAPVRPRRHSKR